MSKEIQTIEVERCDICHRESTILTRTCIICGRDYCSFCEGVSGNVFHQNVCKECFKRKDVESIIDQYILDGDNWIMRPLPDDFFIPEKNGGEHLTDEMVKERFNAIPKEYQETARFIHTVLLTLQQKMKDKSTPCLMARIAIFEVNKELEKKAGYSYPIPWGWYTDAVMIDPEWIVRITNGLVRWEGDESCVQCGRDDCRFYIPRKNDPKSGTKYSMYRRGEKRPIKGKWKKESEKHG